MTPGAVPQTRQWRVPGNVTRPRPASDRFPAVKAEWVLWLGSAFVGIGPLKEAGRRSGGLHTPGSVVVTPPRGRALGCQEQQAEGGCRPTSCPHNQGQLSVLPFQSGNSTGNLGVSHQRL